MRKWKWIAAILNSWRDDVVDGNYCSHCGETHHEGKVHKTCKIRRPSDLDLMKK